MCQGADNAMAAGTFSSVLAPNPLRILTIHAHPDDESSKGAGSIAKYTDNGAHAVLVCCTGGEEGDILNPSLDRPEIREKMTEVRRDELA
ncbi:MAG: PIG-L family deacetylase, partial [Acidimicrobiales bacterium]